MDDNARVCINFQQGYCAKGDQCPLKHVKKELKSKMVQSAGPCYWLNSSWFHRVRVARDAGRKHFIIFRNKAKDG